MEPIKLPREEEFRAIYRQVKEAMVALDVLQIALVGNPFENNPSSLERGISTI